jgi:hypothetical protein
LARDGPLNRLNRCLIEATGGTRDLASAVDDYEQQMLAYGAEAVQFSLKALPTYTSPSRQT